MCLGQRIVKHGGICCKGRLNDETEGLLQRAASYKEMLTNPHCQTSFHFYGIMGEGLSSVTSSR